MYRPAMDRQARMRQAQEKVAQIQESMRQCIDTLETEKKRLQKKIEVHEYQQSSLNLEVSQLQADLERTRRQRDRSREEVAEMKDSVRQVSEENGKIRETIGELQMNMRELANVKRDLQHRHLTQKAQLAKKDTEIFELKRQLRQAHPDSSAFDKSYGHMDIFTDGADSSKRRGIRAFRMDNDESDEMPSMESTVVSSPLLVANDLHIPKRSRK